MKESQRYFENSITNQAGTAGLFDDDEEQCTIDISFVNKCLV